MSVQIYVTRRHETIGEVAFLNNGHGIWSSHFVHVFYLIGLWWSQLVLVRLIYKASFINPQENGFNIGLYCKSSRGSLDPMMNQISDHSNLLDLSVKMYEVEKYSNA